MITEFKDFIDKIQPSLPRKLGLMELYEHYSIEQEHSFSRHGVSDYLHNKIKELLQSETLTELSFKDIQNLKSHFILDSYLNKVDYNPYYRHIDKLNSFIGVGINYYQPFSEVGKWEEAIALLKDLLIINPTEEDAEKYFIETSYQKEKLLAQACIYFKNKGVDIIIEINRAFINKNDETKICNDIANDIKCLGGNKVINSLMNHLKYEERIGRYINVKQTKNLPSDTEEQVPYGFLINTAVKFLQPKEVQVLNPSVIFDRLIKESKHLATIYSVQPYDKFENLTVNPVEIVEYLKKLVLYDTVYTFNQLNHNYIVRIMSGIFNWIDEEVLQEKLGFNLEEYIKVVQLILSLNPKHDVVYFKLNQLKGVDLTNEKITLILGSMAIKFNEVNQDFILPADFSQINFYNQPLIVIDDSTYCLVNKTLCGDGFITNFALTAFGALKKASSFWSKMGGAVEEFIHSELEKKGVDFDFGVYNNFNGVSGDCDLILENDSKILLIETKNKSLTKEARTGDELKLLADIINSLVYEHWQTGKHTLLLSQYGYIQFDDGSKLSLNNREIERIGITFSDYGSIQDRKTAINILDAFIHSVLVIENNSIGKEFNKTYEYVEKMKEQFEKIVAINIETTRFPFFECQFISLPMFLMMLDDSNTKEELIRNVLSLKHIIFGTGDFYAEYFYKAKYMGKENQQLK